MEQFQFINLSLLQLSAIQMIYQQNEQDRFLGQMRKFVSCLKQQILCPDIRIFERELFGYLNKQVKQQQDRIKMMIREQNQDNQNTAHTINIKQQIYKCQTQKIGYLLKQYLRVRIRKIQKYCFYLYKNQTIAQKKLSENEYIFMKGYAEMKYKYIQQNILKNIIKPYRGLGGLQTFFTKTNQTKVQIDTKQSKIQVPEPSTNSYVFCLITGNPDLYRFNADIPVTNVEDNPIIGVNSTLYGQYKYFDKILSESNGQLL